MRVHAYVLIQSIWEQLSTVLLADEPAGNVDGLILKQFTVASLIGCGINPSHLDIQGRGGDGCGGDQIL